MKHFFLNYKIDKQELKRLLSWFVQKYGSTKTTRFADTLKYVGFHYAMQAGIKLTEDEVFAIFNYNSDFAARPLKTDGEKLAAVLRVATMIAVIESK